MAVNNVGKYDKSVQGKQAKLLQDISFYTDASMGEKSKKTFPVGTTVVAQHVVTGTGLTTFRFTASSNKTYDFPLRDGKFKYI